MSHVHSCVQVHTNEFVSIDYPLVKKRKHVVPIDPFAGLPKDASQEKQALHKDASQEKETGSKKENTYIIGVDEVGRGVCAGDVVATACWVKDQHTLTRLLRAGLKDSKKIKSHEEKQSLVYFMESMSPSHIRSATSFVDIETIDEINILYDDFSLFFLCQQPYHEI